MEGNNWYKLSPLLLGKGIFNSLVMKEKLNVWNAYLYSSVSMNC